MKVEAENVRRDEVNQWVKELSELGATIDLPALQTATKADFQLLLLKAKAEHVRRQADEAIRKQEQDELAELRAEKKRRDKAEAAKQKAAFAFATKLIDTTQNLQRNALMRCAAQVEVVLIPRDVGELTEQVRDILHKAATDIRELA